MRVDARVERAVPPPMSGIHDLPLFVAAGLILNVTPGSDLAYIAARGARGGFRSGAAALSRD
jgi:threonine/homoserine/homoserine lactone efflux protein